MTARGVVLRILAAVAVGLALLLPLNGLGSAYATCYRAAGGACLAILGISAIELHPNNSSSRGLFDTVVSVRDVQPGVRWNCVFSSRRTGYIPSVVFLALVIATSMPARKRRSALLWGILGLHLFMILQVSSIVLWNMTSHVQDFPAHGHALLLTSGWLRFWSATQYELFVDSSLRWTVPILIWAAFCARREYWGSPRGMEGREPLA